MSSRHTSARLLIGGIITERRSEKTQPDASTTVSRGLSHVPQIYAPAMDSVISVSDAVPPRSRTVLTEQAEMFASQVPMLHIKLKMRKSFLELLPLLWILLLYQISQTSCASLRNYSSKSVNISVVNSDSSVPKNLSELIEFSPLNIPLEEENITVVHKEVEQQTTPNIITLKLKTQVLVQNYEDGNRKGIQESDKMSSVMPINVSESSLADIEYLDSGNGFEFWKWNSNSRSRRMNEETSSVGDKFSKMDDSSEEESSENIESVFEMDNSKENQISNQVRRSKYARGRQFLFHPYLPYGKDVPPDEKISFHDILPIKMVKFVKSMVEEAPWEQMFIKMVRMIVDQFVDKIIEKMFEDKKQDVFKRRSFDDFVISTLNLPSFHTPLLRMKRSVDKKPSTDQEEEDLFSFLPPPKKGPQDTDEAGKKSDSENKSWLDQFLDFLFPNSKSEMDDDDESYERLRKRDTTNSQLLKKFLTFFLNTFEKSSGFFSDAKDVLRYKMLKELLPFLYNKKYAGKPATSSNAVDAMKMTHRKLADGILERNDVPESETVPERSTRRKRSTKAHYRKVDENRLWQSDRHRSQNHRSHDVCSLRKACNAGRLLARLPSVQEITLQLKTNGNEPHWDALIWGMKKKRCSRIFCKRQRSPKGSRFSWNEGRRQTAKKDQIVTESPNADPEDTNNNLAA